MIHQGGICNLLKVDITGFIGFLDLSKVDLEVIKT